jgi:hypothetical protein
MHAACQRQKHTFPWPNLEDVAVNVCIQCPLQYIEELVFPRVNMRRRLRSAFHVGEYQIESSACVFVCCELSAHDAFVPGGYIYGRRMFERVETDNCVIHVSPKLLDSGLRVSLTCGSYRQKGQQSRNQCNCHDLTLG